MQPTLLIVEDEEDDIFFLKRALNRVGIHNPVQVVQDGHLALDYLRGEGQFADRTGYPLPALIFLDLKLPRFHGFEVLKWMRAQTTLPPIPVIVLTSSAVNDDIERAYRLGANCYVVKPSTPDRLVEIATAFRDWWLKHSTFANPSIPSRESAGA